jgi:hypothetical protein
MARGRKKQSQGLGDTIEKITEIEILYKEADALAVSVVDSIPTVPDPSDNNTEQ